MMREKRNAFLKWAVSNISWDIFRGLLIYLGKGVISFSIADFIASKLPNSALPAIYQILGSVGLSTFESFAILIVLSFFIFGVISFISPPFWLFANYILKSSRPHIIHLNDGNYLVSQRGKQITFAVIDIMNKPGRNTERSIAYDVTVRIEFLDLENRSLVVVKNGFLTQAGSNSFIEGIGKTGHRREVDFYPDENWQLPVVYKWLDDDMIYAYDPASPLKSKKIGNKPVRARITFEGTNLRLTRPIKYFVRPWQDKIWIQLQK